MSDPKAKNNTFKFDIWDLVLQVWNLPGVKVNREDYLRNVFKNSLSEAEISRIIGESPLSVVALDEVDRFAKKAISGTRIKTSLAALLLGLPPLPLPALPPAIALDVTQSFAFWIQIAQKLAYLYGEDDLSKLELEDLRTTLILYLGTMFGVFGAAKAIPLISKNAATLIAKKFMDTAVTKVLGGVLWKTAKAIALLFGIKLTKEVAQRGILKVIPVLGGVVNGALNYAAFSKAAGKLGWAFHKANLLSDEELEKLIIEEAIEVDTDEGVIEIAEEIIELDFLDEIEEDSEIGVNEGDEDE